MGQLHPRTRLAAALRATLVLVALLGGAHPSLAGVTRDPCINVHDLDFGTLRPGENATRVLRISNDGGGVVTFNSPDGAEVITWLHRQYEVTASELAKLRNARLGAGDYVSLLVTFRAGDVGRYADTARIWANVRHCRDISIWSAVVMVPGPQITGYDWQERRIVVGCETPASDRGTKNDVREYLGEIFVTNTGDAPFIVESVALEGADVAHFALDTSDPTRTIATGDRISPYDATRNGPRHFQRILFRPGAEERVYECTVVLRTRDGLEVRNVVRGIGTESHVQSPGPTDFGREVFRPGAPARTGTVTFSTSGTRDVTISGLAIVPSSAASAGQFTILNEADILGKTVPRNSSIAVNVAYAPTGPGPHDAELVVSGDFGPCDDSSATLIGRTSVLSVRATGVDFDRVLMCDPAEDAIVVENLGSDSVTVFGFSRGGEDAFVVETVAFPDTLAPGERLLLPVRFTPIGGYAEYRDSVTIDARDLTGTMPVLFDGRPAVAPLSASTREIVLRSHIDRDYVARPGDTVVVEVVLDELDDEAAIDLLTFSIRYRHGAVTPVIGDEIVTLRDGIDGTRLEGWTVEMTPAPRVDPADIDLSILALRLTAPPGATLRAAGTLLRIAFVVVPQPDTTHVELPNFVTPSDRLACVEIVTSPGLITIEPAPGAPKADVTVGRDDATGDVVVDLFLREESTVTIAVYDLFGRRVRQIAHEVAPTGRSVFRAAVEGIAVGQYFVHVIAGDVETAHKVMLVP